MRFGSGKGLTLAALGLGLLVLIVIAAAAMPLVGLPPLKEWWTKPTAAPASRASAETEGRSGGS